MRRPASLLRRLMLSFAVLLSAVWAVLLAVGIYTAVRQGQQSVARSLSALAGRTLTSLMPLANDLTTMRKVASELEAIEQRPGSAGFAGPGRIQVWKDAQLIYGADDLPPAFPVPAASLIALPNGGHRWVAIVAMDAATGLTVRAAAAHPAVAVLRPQSLAFLLMPLLICLPLLLLPALVLSRRALRPLAELGDEIESRPIGNLAPLSPSPYAEVAPLVESINRLMARARQQALREQEFLELAAHELKTPLAVIRVNAQALASAHDAVFRQRAHVGLEQGIGRAARAVEQLLALMSASAGPDEGRRDQTDLVELVQKRIGMLVATASARSIEIEFDAPDTCVVALFAESATLLVDNLIDNAIKFSPPGTRISVVLGGEAAAPTLTVADQGCGIEPQHRAHVFERFYRVPGRAEPGSGLGLSIVERAAARNGAVVKLETGPGGRGLLVVVQFCGSAPVLPV